MNREQIIRMAREAGITFKPMVIDGVEYDYRHVHCNDFAGKDEADCIERFAALVAAAEREECAKLCESLFDPDDDSCNEADLCVAAIRARGRQ